MKITSRIINAYSKNGIFYIDTDCAKFMIVFIKSAIVRIRCTFDKEFAQEASYILTMTAWEDKMDDILKSERKRVDPVIPLISDNDESIELTTNELKLVVEKHPFAISVFNSEGICLHSDLKEKAFLQDDKGNVYHYTLLNGNDHFYGFGEKTGKINKARKRMRMDIIDAIAYDAEISDPLYKHIPFYIKLNKKSKAACGMFYNNSWQSIFDMGCEKSGYWNSYHYYCAEGGDIDLFFINGPTIKQVIENYTDLTGKTILPPQYSLGYMGSTMYYTELDCDCDKAIFGFLDKANDEKIPCDGFHMSSGYTTGADNKRYVFNWNRKRFKNPQDFIKDMKEKGVELSPNVKPGMLLSHFLYEEFAANGVYIKDRNEIKPFIGRFWGGFASFVDFTNPKGRELWKKYLKEALVKSGVTAIWNDNCEFEISDPKAICDFEGQKCYAGSIRPVLPTLMALVAYQTVIEEFPDIRPYILNRAGFSGIQRYAQTWAGDNNTSWKSLKYNISTMLGMSLSGVANQGIDIGGFAGPAPDPELFVRWIQNAAFYPRFCIHSCNSDNTVTEPWMYPSYTHLIRKAFEFRYSLLPYMYSLFYESSICGTPVMRPLVYEFQNDLNTYEESHDFMFGPYMLIASIVEKGIKTRDIYLPEGSDWYNWYTHEKYSGGQTITIDTPLETVPVFFRSGSIIPMTTPRLNIRKEPIDRLNILIEPSQDSCFTLYEDDGVSNNYKKGNYFKTDISVKHNKRNIEINFISEGTYISNVKRMRLEIVCKEVAPQKILLKGVQIKRFLNLGEFENHQDGYYFEPEKRTAIIKYNSPKEDSLVNVIFE